MSFDNQKTPISESCDNKLVEVVIRVLRDDSGGAIDVVVTRQGDELKTLPLTPGQQIVWRCVDNRFRGAHLEIRLDPKFTPFNGYRYEVGVGSKCSSGPMNERIFELARHKINSIALVTTVDGRIFAKSFLIEIHC